MTERPPSKARRQVKAGALLRKRIQEATEAQDRLREALELTREANLRNKSAEGLQQELDAALAKAREFDLTIIDLDDVDLDIDVDVAEVEDLDLGALPLDDDDDDEDDEIVELTEADYLRESGRYQEGELDYLESRLPGLEEPDDEMEVWEHRIEDLEEVFESARHRIDMSELDRLDEEDGASGEDGGGEDDAELVITPIHEEGDCAGAAVGLARLAAGLRTLAHQQESATSARQLLDDLSRGVGVGVQPTAEDASLDELLRAYLDLARVMAASSTALVTLLERRLGG